MPNDNAKTMHTNRGRSLTLVLVCLLYCFLSCQALDDPGKTPALNQPNISPKNETLVPTSPNPPKLDLSKVAAEGGTIPIQNNLTSASITTNNNDTTHMGREHVMVSDVNEKHNVTQLNTTKVVKTPNNNQSSSAKTHKIEGEKPPITASPDDSYLKYGVAEKNDDKQSVPKKGVEFPAETGEANNVSALAVKPTYSSANVTNFTNTTPKASTNITTIKTRPKKPTITEAHDDEPKPGSNSQQSKPNVSTAAGSSSGKTGEPIPDIPSIDSVTSEDSKKQQRQADYVVPIVAVILSVPLVAIVISVLYKRGAEWWQHRHYRRMDFLIDGMYNN